ncbi:MAG: hypothetical protein FD165_2863, partial [Gammaproteobacteria bacterium]
MRRERRSYATLRFLRTFRDFGLRKSIRDADDALILILLTTLSLV